MLSQRLLAVNIVRFDFEVLLLILAVLMGSSGWRSSEDAPLPGICMVWPNEMSILRVERVHACPVRWVESKAILLANAFLLGLNFLLVLELTSLCLSNSTG